MLHDDRDFPAGQVLCECRHDGPGSPNIDDITVPAGQCACACANELARRHPNFPDDAAKALFCEALRGTWADFIAPPPARPSA